MIAHEMIGQSGRSIAGALWISLPGMHFQEIFGKEVYVVLKILVIVSSIVSEQSS